MNVKNIIPPLVIGDLVAKIPIVQGGMGVGISLSSLAGAVANAGGIGVISVAGLGIDDPDYKKKPLETNIQALKKEIKKARDIAKKIIGVNIMVALTDYAEIVKTAISEEIDIIFAGAGLPLDLPKYLKPEKKTMLVPIVSSAKAAKAIMKRWMAKYNYTPDAFVVEGPKAGGHLGFSKEQIDDESYQLEKLVPQVVDEVKIYEDTYHKTIPIIAAGGIYTGEDIYKIMKLGASGVQLGTRFVATNECDASTEFKDAFIACEKEDLTIISSPVGLPGRAINNTFIEDSVKGLKHPFTCPYHCIITCKHKESPYCIAFALINAKKGNLKNGFAFAGSNTYRVKELLSVDTLMKTLEEEYEAAALKNS